MEVLQDRDTNRTLQTAPKTMSAPPAPDLALVYRYFDATEDLFVHYDRHQCYVWMNAAAARQLGVTLEVAAGKSNRDLFGLAGEVLDIPLRQALASGDNAIAEVSIPTGESSQSYRGSYTPIRDEEGTITGAIANYSKIESLARAQSQLEQRKALTGAIARIHQSLDIDTIFSATVNEVRQLLSADRVAVYQFYSDWSGAFVAESVVQGWTPLLGSQAKDSHFQENNGGRYRHGESLAVDDIYKAGHSECHVRLLEDFEARAYIIVPILQGETLWGLLAAYQNSSPRHWEEDEVDLLAQIGMQFGIALQQAELLEQTQHQKEELARSLQNLKQAQAQLLRSEKMASLGQLVGGLAHEMNNPVSFIYGNLEHVESYTRDLLALVQLYQRHYPQPAAEIQAEIEAIELNFIADDLPDLLASMHSGADRIRQLVQSLQTFSSLDRQQLNPVNVGERIDNTLLILQHRLKATETRPAIEVVKDYSELPSIECYGDRLDRVFMNLFSNAIDAIESRWKTDAPASDSPTIRIQTRCLAENRVEIAIADNGCGIPENERSRIFDPFFTTKPIGQGTGLGLSISYQVVEELHGGQLRCESIEGEGSEFAIALPIARSQG
jgi:signal transduction histidine kinase